MSEKIVVTAAYPFIPAEINMAHMASTYIPADIYFRFLRQLKKEVVLVSATDVHGITIKNMSRSKQIEIEEIIQFYHQKYSEIFNKMGIEFSCYSRTDTNYVKELVYNSLYKLRENGKIYRSRSINYLCQNCGEYLPKHFRLASENKTAADKMILNNDKFECYFCHSHDITQELIEHWFLKFDDQSKEVVENVIDNQCNSFVRKYLKSVYVNGLHDWDFTRDNYWGLEIPFSTVDKRKQYIYLWYESLIAYLSLITFEEGNTILFKHFMSKNIVYYHGIIWPILLYLGCQGTENFEIQIAVKGFLNIKDSNNDLVDIDKALSMYDKDYLRFYVTYVVKDNITDFKFELSEFKNVINSVLCKNIGGFYKRCRNTLYKYNIEKVPDIEYRDAQFDDLIQLYKKQYKNMESYKLLMDALIYIKHCGKEIELNKIYNYPTIENIGLLCFMMAGALILMKKFIPDLVEIYNIFEELDLSCISSIDNLKGKKIIKRDGGWGQI